MSTLITNLPAQHVWVRREYLRDLRDGHGEFVRGIWLTAKSIPGRALYFETYLPDYGAIYDKLPISAFTQWAEPLILDLPLDELQYWNCMDYGVVSIVKQFTASMVWHRRRSCTRIFSSCCTTAVIASTGILAFRSPGTKL